MQYEIRRPSAPIEIDMTQIEELEGRLERAGL